MDWRRFAIASFAQSAVVFAIDRPWPMELVAGALTTTTVYLALGYLRERR